MRITGLDIDEFFLNAKLDEKGHHYLEACKNSSHTTVSSIKEITKITFDFPIEDFDDVIDGEYGFTRNEHELLITTDATNMEGEIEFTFCMPEHLTELMFKQTDNSVVWTIALLISYTDGVTESQAYLVIKWKSENIETVDVINRRLS